MNLGFETVKDILDTLIIPFILLIIGRLIVVWNKRQKEREFMKLIFRETEEMAPFPLEKDEKKEWCEYLKKRFIHEETFLNSNSNLDFILSIDPNLVYVESQLWIAFKKAEDTLKNSMEGNKSDDKLDKNDHKDEMDRLAGEWLYFLEELCKLLKKKYSGNFISVRNPFSKKVNRIKKFDPYEKIYQPWEKIINSPKIQEVK